MENPPYSESGSGGIQGTGKKENVWKQSYVIQEMKKEYKGVALNDLSNLFIWSGFKFYLKKPTDSYILYAPTKYWRNQNLANKKFEDGFLCNRKEFHANQVSAIGCIWWKNIDDTDTKQITLTPYDIEDQVTSRATNDITIKKAFYNLSYAYDKRPLVNYSEDGIICERDGSEFVSNGRKVYIKPIYSNEIIAYLVASNFQIDRKDVMLTRCGIYKAHGFYLRSDNFTEKLPLFVAATFPYDKWYKADVYSKSYDGQGSFLKDKDFLKKCLFYTALTQKNKCKSFLGSDKRFYRNELCFDREDTLAWQSLQEYINDGLELSETEETLLKYWRDVLFEASKTDEYKAADKKVRYGLWQIMQELNIKIDSGRKDKKGNPVMVYKYNALNSEIKKLDDALKNYYSNEIIPMLFEYELIK